MAAARDMFATYGYARSGREAIVASAGVTRGALQHHFGDKQALFRAVYEEVEQEVVAATAQAAMAVGHDQPVEMLRLFHLARASAVKSRTQSIKPAQ